MKWKLENAVQQSICKKMRQIRKDYGDSIRFLAREIGFCSSTVQRYDSGGDVPTLQYIYFFCKYYGVSADYLLGLTKEAKK
jgi:transcriptional regulator with XRE-family HTH domain